MKNTELRNKIARAAITAMMTPTEAMEMAGRLESDLCRIYQAMLTAALAEGE